MLDDDFPAMSVVMRQAESNSFKQRQHWERLIRVKFSQTIRRHMRDATIYTPEKVWSQDESAIATAIIAQARRHPLWSDEELVEQPLPALDTTPEQRASVMQKLQQFPHIFELAHARNQLCSYELDGTPATGTVPSTITATQIKFGRWCTPSHTLTPS